MTKYYKANTNVSVSVVLPSKKSLRISFTPLSDGTSTYQTNKEDVQTALERHYKFGRLFKLIRTEGVSDAAKEASKTPDRLKAQPVPAEQNAMSAAKEVASEVHPVEKQTQKVQSETDLVAEAVVEQEQEQEEVASEVRPAEEQKQDEERLPEERPEPEDKPRKVKVSDLATAKDYLADKFGVSRTTMRSLRSILAQAEAHGIEFVGI